MLGVMQALLACAPMLACGTEEHRDEGREHGRESKKGEAEHKWRESPTDVYSRLVCYL